jgi:hypothetical protein
MRRRALMYPGVTRCGLRGGGSWTVRSTERRCQTLAGPIEANSTRHVHQPAPWGDGRARGVRLLYRCLGGAGVESRSISARLRLCLWLQALGAVRRPPYGSGSPRTVAVFRQGTGNRRSPSLDWAPPPGSEVVRGTSDGDRSLRLIGPLARSGPRPLFWSTCASIALGSWPSDCAPVSAGKFARTPRHGRGGGVPPGREPAAHPAVPTLASPTEVR